MNRTPVAYTDLNARQKELYNFSKVAALLMDYGYHCLKLSDDWNGADFIAVHFHDATSLHVQLKSRLVINDKYQNKNLYLCFPIQTCRYLVLHDELLAHLKETTTYLSSSSWLDHGNYSTQSPNATTMNWLEAFKL